MNWFHTRMPSAVHSGTCAIKSCHTCCPTFCTSCFVSAHRPPYVLLVVTHFFMKLLKFLHKLQLVENQPLTSSTHPYQHPPLKQLQGLLGQSCIDCNILLLTFKAPLCVVDSRNIQTFWYASAASLFSLHPPDHPPWGSGPLV